MLRVIKSLVESGCEEVVLEAEVTNVGALRLYERLGFLRDKRLKRWAGKGTAARGARAVLLIARPSRHPCPPNDPSARYYLNGSDAYRLKLPLARSVPAEPQGVGDLQISE